MAVYELLESNHPSLSVPVTEVTDSQEGREQIQQDLVDTMRAKSGIGLSANHGDAPPRCSAPHCHRV